MIENSKTENDIEFSVFFPAYVPDVILYKSEIGEGEACLSTLDIRMPSLDAENLSTSERKLSREVTFR